jgi:hypothetical protein
MRAWGLCDCWCGCLRHVASLVGNLVLFPGGVVLLVCYIVMAPSAAVWAVQQTPLAWVTASSECW